MIRLSSRRKLCDSAFSRVSMTAPNCATVVTEQDLPGGHRANATMSSMLTSGEEVMPLTTFKQRLYHWRVAIVMPNLGEASARLPTLLRPRRSAADGTGFAVE